MRRKTVDHGLPTLISRHASPAAQSREHDRTLWISDLSVSRVRRFRTLTPALPSENAMRKGRIRNNRDSLMRAPPRAHSVAHRARLRWRRLQRDARFRCDHRCFEIRSAVSYEPNIAEVKPAKLSPSVCPFATSAKDDLDCATQDIREAFTFIPDAQDNHHCPVNRQSPFVANANTSSMGRRPRMSPSLGWSIRD